MKGNKNFPEMKLAGKAIDEESRCVHYHSPRDIVAIKFSCCQQYYPCFKCHQETAEHSIRRWKKTEFGEKAVLCGHCKLEMTIYEYLSCGAECPSCKATFNERCHHHFSLYFEI